MTLARHNPFRTQRLEAIAFRPRCTSWPRLLDHLVAMNYRCAIVGPCGSGKTTLLEQLAELLKQQGHQVKHARINEAGLCVVAHHFREVDPKSWTAGLPD